MAVFHHIHNDLASALAERLTGEVIAPEHAEYDAARRVWNGMIDKRPAAIARCADADDVATAVRFAAERELPLAVRGGGHNVAGTAVVDDGLVIDLSAMRGRAQSTPPAARCTCRAARRGPTSIASPRRWASPRRRSRVRDRRRRPGAQRWRLAPAPARRDDRRQPRLAEVVLADGRQAPGERRRAPDLHWALRGGGGNFGVVTVVRAAPARARARGLRAERRLPARGRRARARPVGATPSPARPDELSTAGLIWSLPVVDDLPEPLRGLPYVGVAGMWAGRPGRGRARHAPPARAGHPAARHERARGLSRLPVLTGSVLPCGPRRYWKALYLDGCRRRHRPHRSTGRCAARRPDTLVIVRHCGGAI
jgi:hypothetical protein